MELSRLLTTQAPGKTDVTEEATTYQHRSKYSGTDPFSNLILPLFIGSCEVVLSSWSKHPERHPGNNVTFSSRILHRWDLSSPHSGRLYFTLLVEVNRALGPNPCKMYSSLRKLPSDRKRRQQLLSGFECKEEGSSKFSGFICGVLLWKKMKSESICRLAIGKPLECVRVTSHALPNAENLPLSTLGSSGAQCFSCSWHFLFLSPLYQHLPIWYASAQYLFCFSTPNLIDEFVLVGANMLLLSLPRGF